MIYIDHFTSEKFIPIYIGQSKNIQTRYKQHFSEILTLNRLSNDEYNKYFFSKNASFYEGRFKTCKIFKFMVENNCTLQDFHMNILEEVEEEHLDEKEQEYFQRLFPSFFGFNQFNSFLKQLKLRFSNSQMSNSEIDDYLRILLEDVKGIYSYYEYGLTRFNFEHSIARDIAYLMKDKEQLNSDTLSKYDEVKFNLDELFKLYKLDIENKEIQRLNEKVDKLFEDYQIAKAEYDEGGNQQNKGIIQIFKGIFDKNIKNNKQQVGMDNKFELYHRANILKKESLKEMRHKRYKLIFPSCKFGSFSLGDRSNNHPIKINEDNELLNTYHIQIYISNNGVSRSDTVIKEPYIIKVEYCYIDNEGNKSENKYYIDNETTKNSQAGLEYFEKDFYNMFAFKKTRFTISSLINNEKDNSFISIQAEYKHGINDYTLTDKKLIKLSVVLDEIKQLTDEETRFNIDISESANCLKICMINEGLQNNMFVDKILEKKLPKIKKRKKSPIKKAKEVVNKTDLTENNKVKRAEAYKHNVLLMSDNGYRTM